ncbi:hypothetical protein [Lentzea sp. E54]|uniref:hypothetical protein n=1 Tax=Lentzea xerophila TaxID=3435883 RepID=UPI003DA20364
MWWLWGKPVRRGIVTVCSIKKGSHRWHVATWGALSTTVAAEHCRRMLRIRLLARAGVIALVISVGLVTARRRSRTWLCPSQKNPVAPPRGRIISVIDESALANNGFRKTFLDDVRIGGYATDLLPGRRDRSG